MCPFTCEMCPFTCEMCPFICEICPFIYEICPFICEMCPFICEMCPFFNKIPCIKSLSSLFALCFKNFCCYICKIKKRSVRICKEQ